MLIEKEKWWGCAYAKRKFGRLRRGDPFFKNGRKNEKKPEKMRRERFWDLNPSKIFQNRLG